MKIVVKLFVLCLLLPLTFIENLTPGIQKWRDFNRKKHIGKLLYYLAENFNIYVCRWDGYILHPFLIRGDTCQFCGNSIRDTRQYYYFYKSHIVYPYKGCLFPDFEDELKSARETGWEWGSICIEQTLTHIK